MRLTTVKRLLRLTILPEEAIEYVYNEMKGITDREVYSFKCQKWIETLSNAFDKYPAPSGASESERRCGIKDKEIDRRLV